MKQHEAFTPMSNIPIHAMQKGQKIVIVRMLLDAIERMNLDVPQEANRYCDNDRGKAWYMHL